MHPGRTILSFICLLTVGTLGIVPEAGGQSFSVLGADIPDGASNVPLRDSISFTFNKKLPFNSLWTSAFHWEPARRSDIVEYFLDAERVSPRIAVDHTADTDYSVYVFGARAEDGSGMDRPFVVNYTTAASAGLRSVGGQVTFGDRSAGKRSARLDALRALVHQNAATGRRSLTQVGKAETQNINYTVVLLLDRFETDNLLWSVRAAAAIQSDGSFGFGHVRPGTYYPIAINYADDDGITIGAIGIHDLNGDFSPDTIAVDSSDLSGIDLTLYSLEPATALTTVDLASSNALALAPDARLVGITSFDVANTGLANAWTYDFLSPSSGNQLGVYVDPVVVDRDEFPFNGSPIDVVTIPEGITDSDQAMAVAEANGGSAFRQTHQARQINVWVRGGNRYVVYPPSPDRPVWTVDYSVVGDPSTLRVYVDMVSGQWLDPLATSAEQYPQLGPMQLGTAFPNPSSNRVTIPYSISDPGRYTLDLHDIMGRKIATLADRFHTPGSYDAGYDVSGLAAGPLFVRLTSGRRTEMSAAVIVR